MRLVLAGWGSATAVGIDVGEEPEEWVAGGCVVGNEGLWEERHFAFCWCFEKSSLGLFDWKS